MKIIDNTRDLSILDPTLAIFIRQNHLGSMMNGTLRKQATFSFWTKKILERETQSVLSQRAY